MSTYMATTNTGDAKVCLLGLPYDSTTSYRPGARFGPEHIRSASYGIETFDPIVDMDLEDLNILDLGDLELGPGDPKRVIAQIESYAGALFESGKRVLSIGGEHLLSYPLIKSVSKAMGQDSLKVIQIDAHADLRTEYLGEQYSHATVMRHVVELVGYDNIRQVGIRSGTRDEWQLMRGNGTYLPLDSNTVNAIKEWAGNSPIYLTLDLDVLDPSVLPGTGAPEPGGVSYRELEDLLVGLFGLNIVAGDVMELAPILDTSGVSAVVAAKVVRTLLFLLSVLT